MRLLISISALSALVFPIWVLAQNQIELDTTTITGNTELPKFLYVVPWQDRQSNQKQDQKLVLHNLYGDLFDPVLPAYIVRESFELLETPSEEK